jgi:hypothetical protein
MADNPGTFVRVSLPHGHFTVTAVTAERGGWRVLKRAALDAKGRPLPPKLREDKLAATPTDPEASASVDTPKE